MHSVGNTLVRSGSTDLPAFCGVLVNGEFFWLVIEWLQRCRKDVATRCSILLA